MVDEVAQRLARLAGDIQDDDLGFAEEGGPG